MSDILGIAGVLVGLAGLAFAIYQGSERRRLSDYIRSQNWHLYSKANNANGATQLGLRQYKADHAGSLSPDVVELLARADGFGQDVFWLSEGRISSEHAGLFRNLAPANNSFRPNPLRRVVELFRS